MSRAPYDPLTYQPEEVTLNFSFQVTNAGAISLIRGGGGKVVSVGGMASGVSVVTLATPRPYQLVCALGSVNLVAAGVDGGSVEVDTVSYNNSAGTFNIRHCVAAGTVGNPVGTSRINVTCVFVRRKTMAYS
jgi:hypothetical protein